jgi:hypothetical protein
MSNLFQLLFPVLAMIAGALLGSWLYWRGSNRRSPLPELPKFGGVAGKAEEASMKLPRPKP